MSDFLLRYGIGLVEAISRNYPPKVEFGSSDSLDFSQLSCQPLGLQGDAIAALVRSIKDNKGTLLVGEMGVGKTNLAIVSAHFSGSSRTLVMCPPHLVEKWVREVRITIPGVHAQALDSMTEVDRLPHLPKGFYILSREKAKLGPLWKAVAHWKVRKTEEVPVQLPYCPNCGQLVLINDVVPTHDDLTRCKHYCPHCNSPLWTVDHTGPRRYPLSDYIKRRLPKKFFDLLVIDEAHEFKSGSSSQGISAGLLAEHCKRTLAATGTLFGGYASTLFYLLWRFSPELRKDFRINEEARFVELYGLLERTYKEGDPEDARSSRGKRRKVSTREKPGISPLLLPHLLPNVVFVRLPDVAEALPSYLEVVHKFDMTDEQAEVHNELKGQLESKLQEMLKKGSKRLLGAYLQSLLHHPDTPWCEEVVTSLNPDTGETDLVAHAPALTDKVLYPKEQALLDLILQEWAQGRRVWVYVQGVESRDVTGRLKGFLSQAGLRVEVLRSDTVNSRQREEWVKRMVNRGVDVVISHPKLVQTGLDLLDFPTLLFMQVEYSVYTLRQSARRSWRIGQKRGVKVIHMVYRGTLQERAVRLIAAKAKSSLALEGELSDSGLTQQAEDDLLVSLAKSLVEEETQHDWQDSYAEENDLSGMGSESFVGEQPKAKVKIISPSAQIEVEVLVHYLEEDLVISAGRRKKVVSANQGMLFPI